jgi:hypothetical protein
MILYLSDAFLIIKEFATSAYLENNIFEKFLSTSAEKS